MFGLPIDGPANVFCDCNAVVKNTMIPESMLAKKQNAIDCHAVREAVAAKIICVGNEDGMTKSGRSFHEGAHCRRLALSLLILSPHVLVQSWHAMGYQPLRGQGLLPPGAVKVRGL
jgi:hypothetical protein